MKSFQTFIDSSVLIEHLKGNPDARNLLQELIIKDGEINDVVASEVIFIYLKTVSGKEPRKCMRKKRKIYELELEAREDLDKTLEEIRRKRYYE